MQLSHSKVRYRYKPDDAYIIGCTCQRHHTLGRLGKIRSSCRCVSADASKAHQTRVWATTNKQTTTTKRPAATSAACADTFVCNLLIHCAFKARQKRTRTHQRLEGRWLNGRHYYSPCARGSSQRGCITRTFERRDSLRVCVRMSVLFNVMFTCFPSSITAHGHRLWDFAVAS